MKLQFKHQKFQADAAKAVCDVFAGQPCLTPSYMMDKGKGQVGFAEEAAFTGWNNHRIVPELNEQTILENIRRIQRSHQIPPSGRLEGRYNLTIEMETGVGKTYTYIKTMYELNQRYGWSKFIIVVPSVAIREGVYKSFQMTEEHFAEDYGKKIRCFIYNSAQLTEIDRFAGDSAINVMIINSQAFNARGKDARRIYMKLDEFRSRRPIDILARTNPIMIIDEPQSVEGKVTKERLKEFNPLVTLRYSATHKLDSVFNMIYRLDAMDAYNKKLVKKIAVKGISQTGTTATEGYVYLESVNLSKGNPTATIEFDLKGSTGIRKARRTVDEGYNLYAQSGELNEYADGFTVLRIDGRDSSIEFTNGRKLYAGDVIGKVSEDQLRRIQIRETILTHIERERQLFYKGIKVLSLFFIDEVAKYRQYDEAGQAANGEYARVFEEEYAAIIGSLQYSAFSFQNGVSNDGLHELSRLKGLAKSNGIDCRDLQVGEVAAKRGDIRAIRSNETGSRFDSIEYSGGTGEELTQGVSTIHSSCAGFEGGAVNSASDMCSSRLPVGNGNAESLSVCEGNRRDAAIAQLAAENRKLNTENSYENYLLGIPVDRTHAGYFSIDKKSSRMVDSKLGDKKERTSDDSDAYDLIMKNKERLLDRREPVRFIFSHSALREGWDNPNVFQICTLKQSGSDVRKRQEVGRGLRLCVNQGGERMDANLLGDDVHNVNMLTVIASESYDSFAKGLQAEIAEAVADRPRMVNADLFIGKVIKSLSGAEQVIDQDLATVLYEGLITSGYVKKGALTDQYYEDKKNGSIEIAEEAADCKADVIAIIDSIYDSRALKPDNARKNNVEIKLDKGKLDSAAFRALWRRISTKSVYVVDFDEEELIGKAIAALNKELRVSRVQFRVDYGTMAEIKSKEQLMVGEAMMRKESATYTAEVAANENIKYDLVGKVVAETGLTRRAVVSIMKGIDAPVFKQFANNPEEFIIKASAIINEQKATAIIQHITYNKLDASYDTGVFTEPTMKGQLGVNAMEAGKHLYDYILYDSGNEREFAQRVDASSEVAVYV